MPRALGPTPSSHTVATAAKPPSASPTASRTSFKDALEPPEPSNDEQLASPEEPEAAEGAPALPQALALSTSGGLASPTPNKEKPEAPVDPHRAKADPLDPETRHAAQWAPSFEAPPPELRAAAPAEGTMARASLETLLPELVDKVAWSCDRRRGSIRLELRAGALAGGSVVVHADDGKVRVEIRTPAGADVEEWRALLHDRLLQRGIDLEHLTVE
jgi:hypothetical protein